MGELFGDTDGLRDGVDDPPVFARQVRVVLAFDGGDSGRAVELAERTSGDLANYWREGVIRAVRYPPPAVTAELGCAGAAITGRTQGDPRRQPGNAA
jgi:hypothetical protein